MAKSENQKQKLVRILEIMFERTGDEVGITINELISALAEYGISAERKSIYNDFITLEELGFPIIRLFGNPPTYTLGERIFELPELKMLTDAVQSSKFITADKSREIIGKLRRFAGKNDGGELSRQIFVEDRVKTENTTSLYTVDAIHKGINDSLCISFCYFDYTYDKKKVLRHGGKKYLVAPKALVWSDENYYLVGIDEEEGRLKNFRVDKMTKVSVTDTEFSIYAEGYRLNPADYSKKIFGMYGGREELVTLEARERLAAVIIDRFGSDATMFKSDFGFRVSLRVMISPTFFSWLMSFGADMRILEPQSVRDEFIVMLDEIQDNYR